MSGEVTLTTRLNRTVFQALPTPQKLYVPDRCRAELARGSPCRCR
jgi:hypothetical protein